MQASLKILEKDTNAAIKAILSELEKLARMEPTIALDPDIFGEARRNVVRRLWALSRKAAAIQEALYDSSERA